MPGHVDLDAPDANGQPNEIGSGYYLGDRAILTAGHVVY
jgi:hypothetical protein